MAITIKPRQTRKSILSSELVTAHVYIYCRLSFYLALSSDHLIDGKSILAADFPLNERFSCFLYFL